MSKRYLTRATSEKRVQQISFPLNLNQIRTQRKQDNYRPEKIFQNKFQQNMIKHSIKSSKNGENEKVYSIYKQIEEEQNKDRYSFELQEKNEQIVNLLKRVQQKQQYITKLQKKYLQNLKINPNVNLASQLYLISEAVFQIRDNIPKKSNSVSAFTCIKHKFSHQKINLQQNSQLQNSQYDQSNQYSRSYPRPNQFNNYQEDNQFPCTKFISLNIDFHQLYKNQNLSDSSSEDMNEVKLYQVQESINCNQKQMISTFCGNSINQSMKQEHFNIFKNQDTLLQNQSEIKNYRNFTIEKLNLSKQIIFNTQQRNNYIDQAIQTNTSYINTFNMHNQINFNQGTNAKFLKQKLQCHQIKQEDYHNHVQTKNKILNKDAAISKHQQKENNNYKLISNILSYHNIQKKQQNSDLESQISKQQELSCKIFQNVQIQTQYQDVHKNMKHSKGLINIKIDNSRLKKKNPLKIDVQVLTIKIDNDLQRKKQSKRKFKSLIKSNLQILMLIWKFTVKHVKTYPKDPAYSSKLKQIEQSQHELDIFIKEYNEGYKTYMTRNQQQNLQFENQSIDKIKSFTQFFSNFNKNVA